ncbi:hypothetical protein CRG98_005026 [Punica granatum]|uniref:Dolichyl-diphosphooligosaccharide--protein glycosyltransferase subunit 4A n=1 Tax=Punica granatum TaxID=22663 RepID=A0A2I0L1W5_PUNGR|nr:hypothetical protein CRG98_005026 [Punica granatum]
MTARPTLIRQVNAGNHSTSLSLSLSLSLALQSAERSGRRRLQLRSVRSSPRFQPAQAKMFDDQDLGFFANFLGIFIFVLVIAYHYVMADPKYEGN